MSHQYKAVAAVLKSTITSINDILKGAEDEMHRIRITGDLQRSHDQLLLLTGTGDLETGGSTVLGPAKTIGGKPIGKVRRFTEADMVPADDKVYKLKQDIEDALVYFGPDADSAGILANIPELIIRGVAKKAGLKVTKDEPQELTVEFIEKIKEALAGAGLKGEHVDEDFNEKEYLSEKFVIAGGTAEVQEASEVVGDPMGAGKVLKEELSKGFENAIMGGDPTAPVGDGMMTKQAEAPQDQPKADEPKQDPKPDTKKKTGK